MPTFARGMVFDVRVMKPPAVGGLLNVVTYELFRFEDLRPGKHGSRYLYIGASEACDMVIDDPCVSSIHALVDCRSAGIFRLLDAGSRNGVFRVIDRHTEKVEYLDLAVGQRIVIGATTLLCVTEDGHAPLTAFDVSEFLFTPDDTPRATQVAGRHAHSSQRKTLVALWQVIRRGKRE
jgi:pSer/pThr/pTyr-binding forkhead associated (FHA) protein